MPDFAFTITPTPQDETLSYQLCVLLVSEDAWLTNLTRKLAEELEFEVVIQTDLRPNFELYNRLALVLLHDTSRFAKEEIKAFIELAASGESSTSILVITDQRKPEVMIEYLRSGAADCVSGPVEPDRMSFLFDSLTFERRILWEEESKQAGPNQSGWFSSNGSEPICASSVKLANVVKKIEKVAPQNTNILMTGETGVGKTRLSRMIHEMSPRRNEPFVVVNCAAMPTMLLESELFGHRRGAFTGADKNQDGKFSHVAGGTLLLDEVDTLSLEAQAKLLRTVESRVFEALGSNKSETFRGRLIVATNRDLSKSVEAGEFRADLYYRLNVVEICIPPLRERPEEILDIAEACIVEFANDNQIPTRKISPEVADVLVSHDWPGNIRELRNAIEQAMTFATGECIRLSDLPDAILGIQRVDSAHETVQQRPAPPSRLINSAAPKSLEGARALGEKQHLIEVLRECGNNRSKAAKTLGISRTALYKKLSKYGLTQTG